MSKLFALFFALLFAIGIRGGWLHHRKWAIGMIGRDLASQNDLRVVENQDVHDQQTIANYVKEIDRLNAEIARLKGK